MGSPAFWLAVTFLIIAGISISIVEDFWHHWIGLLVVGIAIWPALNRRGNTFR